MKIFISHATQDKTTADSVALSLRTRGHKVFLDRDDLPAGASFEKQIERAVKDSDLFIFLISSDSVAEGRFTLTELRFARQKWPNPNNRVLPVMVRKIPLDQVPPYLKVVSILEPTGNIAAETSVAAETLQSGWDARKTIKVSCIASILSVLTVQAVAMNILNPTSAGLWSMFTTSALIGKFIILYLIPACISGSLAGLTFRLTQKIYAIIIIILSSGFLYAALEAAAFPSVPTDFPSWHRIIWSLMWAVGFGVFYFVGASLFGGPRLPYLKGIPVVGQG
jgi:TIR domain